MILTELPIYMKNILHFNTKAVSYFMSKVVQIIKYNRDFEWLQNALWTALPYLMMWMFGLFMAQVADMAVNKKWASLNFVRKASNTLGEFGHQSTAESIHYRVNQSR